MPLFPSYPLTREINVTALVTAFRVRRKNDFYFDGETHDFYELVYVSDGRAGILAGERIYSLEQGQCMLHPPGEFHRIWAEDATCPEMIIFSFYASAMPEGIGGRYCLSPSLQMAVEEWMEENLRVFVHEDIFISGIAEPAGARRQLCRLELLLSELFSTSPDHRRVDSGSAGAYTEIVRLMKEHLNQSLTVEELSSLCHMSKSNMKRIFFRYSGMGVIRYFNRMRMDRACQLLLTGESVGSVARQLGFSDQNYFSTVFHRITGLSPTAYARQTE